MGRRHMPRCANRGRDDASLNPVMDVLSAERFLHTGTSSSTLHIHTLAVRPCLHASSYPENTPSRATRCCTSWTRIYPHLVSPPTFRSRWPDAVDAMAGQQQQILDTIFSMKRKMLKKDDCRAACTSTQCSANTAQLTQKIPRRLSVATSRT